MSTLNTVNQLFKELKTEFSKGARDLKKCGTLLEQLKASFVTVFFFFLLNFKPIFKLILLSKILNDVFKLKIIHYLLEN